MSAIRKHMIERFLLHYGAPKTDSKKEFFAEYERLLSGANPEIVREAADLLIRRHEFHVWPTVGECQKAIETVAVRRATARKMDQFNHQPPGERRERPTDESKVRVDALLKEAKSNLMKFDKPVGVGLPRIPWEAGQKPAWENRMAADQNAKYLSLPDVVRAELEGRSPRRW